MSFHTASAVFFLCRDNITQDGASTAGINNRVPAGSAKAPLLGLQMAPSPCVSVVSPARFVCSSYLHTNIFLPARTAVRLGQDPYVSFVPLHPISKEVTLEHPGFGPKYMNFGLGWGTVQTTAPVILD